MPKFSYSAVSSEGVTVTGELNAYSLSAASNSLFERGYIPSKIKEQRTGLAETITRTIGGGGIKRRELILFSKQLGTMIKAGIPILRIFEVLELQTENSRLKVVITEIIQDIKGGSAFYDAFIKHPKIFSPLYCAMIQAGESSGTLPDVIDRLIYIIEHEDKIRSDIKSALTYPAIVVVALVGAFAVLLTFVIPTFAGIFRGYGIKLPLPTRISIVMYDFSKEYWYIVLLFFFAGVVSAFFYLRTENGKYNRDLVFIRIPVLGPLFVKAAMSRFASIFAILQRSGVPILDIMNILAGTIGNRAIGKDFDMVTEALTMGRGIAGPLEEARFFPPMVVNMVAIGEESGNLEDMLQTVSVHYDVEVEFATKRLSDAIGPVLVVGLAAIVGFFAISVYLPMWDLVKIFQR